MRENTTIRGAVAHPVGGFVALAGFPGVVISVKGDVALDPEAMAETVRGLAAIGVTEVVILVEPDELPDDALASVTARYAEAKIAMRFLPIPDYAFPPPKTRAAWAEMEPEVLCRLGAGEGIAFNCLYGAGRSGIMAAWMLIRAGVAPPAAIAAVRAAFNEAIETESQQQWLLNCDWIGPGDSS